MVKMAMLSNVQSDSSTSINVEYVYMDPYAQLGMVYLEIHNAADLDGFTISECYNGSEDADKQAKINAYMARFKSNGGVAGDLMGNRVSINSWSNSYTFTHLEKGATYYVVMGHQIIKDKVATSYLDDCIKVATREQNNAVRIESISLATKDSVTTNIVTVNLSTEDLKAAGGIKFKDEKDPDQPEKWPESKLTLYGIGKDEIKRQIGTALTLSLDNKKAAAEGVFPYYWTVPENLFQCYDYLIVSFTNKETYVDKIVDDQKVWKTRTVVDLEYSVSNPYYDETAVFPSAMSQAGAVKGYTQEAISKAGFTVADEA